MIAITSSREQEKKKNMEIGLHGINKRITTCYSMETSMTLDNL